jgi:hypothetical protein
VTGDFLLLQAKTGQPADPAVFVGDGIEREPGDAFTARDGSRWRIVSVDVVPPQLAAEGSEAAWIVEPLD